MNRLPATSRQPCPGAIKKIRLGFAQCLSEMLAAPVVGPVCQNLWPRYAEICAGMEDVNGRRLDQEAASVLQFWFADSSKNDQAISSRMPVWFGSDAAIDEEIRMLFGELVETAAAGRLEHWAGLALGRLALVILLDQFPRNLYRGTARAFAHDPLALAICEQSMDDGSLLTLAAIQQVFMLMPLQHAESKLIQSRSVKEFENLLDRLPPARREAFKGFTSYAHLHASIVHRFGRFPHRNAILGRMNTTAEEKYLAGDAPRFGQT